jgi:hypothetical protein
VSSQRPVPGQRNLQGLEEGLAPPGQWRRLFPASPGGNPASEISYEPVAGRGVASDSPSPALAGKVHILKHQPRPSSRSKTLRSQSASAHAEAVTSVTARPAFISPFKKLLELLA